MFKKGPDIDKKKLLSKALDVKKDSLSRLKHFKTLIEHLDFNEVPSLFRTHFSFIYHTFIDTFSTFDCNSKQRRDDLDCILFMLEKILVYNPELIKKRWQFYSITFVMQKLLHQNNTWRLRQEGVRLFILWYQILCDETNLELQTMFGSLVPGIVPQLPDSQQLPSPQQQQQQPPPPQLHSPSNQNSPPLPIKLCSIDPLVPMSANEQLPNDESSFYLDSLLQFMITQITKPFWGSPDETRKNQELSFSFMFNMFKMIYLHHLFPNFTYNHHHHHHHHHQNLSLDATPKSYFSNHSIHQYVDEVNDIQSHNDIENLPPNNNNNNHNSNSKTKRDLLQIDLKHHSNYHVQQAGQTNAEQERLITLSVYQSIVIRWLTRILRQDMIPGQDELIKPNSVERNFQASYNREASSGGGQMQDQEISYVSEANSTNIFQNMETTSREMEIARRVIGTWPDNISIIHELFRRSFLNYYQPASMKRVVNVYKEWICNGGPNQQAASSTLQGRSPRLGYTSFGDLLQIFVLNSSNAFVSKVHNQTMLDEQVEMCKRIMNIYRYMVMKIYMNTATWEQLLNVMLSITEHLFPIIPPEKKESTIGGRIAPAFFQTFIVSWIRANLYVHISTQMWNEFHRVMKNLIKWRELIEEWSTTMGSLTRVLVKHVYGLSLIDLPLDKPQERRRRPRAIKSFSTAEQATTTDTSNKVIHGEPINESNESATNSNNNNNNNNNNNTSNSNNSSTNTTNQNTTLKPPNRTVGGDSIRTTGGNLQSSSFRAGGLTRSNSDGIIVVQKNAKLYLSSIQLESETRGGGKKMMRKIKSEYLFFDTSLDLSNNFCRGSNSPSNTDVIDNASLKDPHLIIDNDHVIPESQFHANNTTSNKSSDSVSLKSNNNKKLQDQKSNADKCVLLGGSVRGWTPENSVIMWRRMLGLFGNINQIEDPDNHLVAMRCLAVILCDFIKTRENLGISLDNQTTPEKPSLIPPHTYHAGWLLEATHLPRQFKESRLIAYKLLCLMSIRRHDIELSQQYYTAFYESLHRGLNSPDPVIHASIIKNSTLLLSLELPGCTFLVNDLFEKSKSILLNNSRELPIQSSPRDQAIQILNTILALHRPIKKLMVLKSEINNPMNLVAPGEIKIKIFDTFLACNVPPVLLDPQTRSRSLCSMTIHVYQELCDKYDCLEVEKLFDTLLTDLQDSSSGSGSSNSGDLFRINCDLLRLFADHASSLVQSRPALVSSIIQIICQLIVRMSTNENNKEAIHCLLICLEDWCIAVGKNYLLKSVEQLSSEDDDDETLSASLNETLVTIVLRSLENVMNDEQFIDDSSNKTTRGSINTSKGSDTHSNSQVSQGGNSDNNTTTAKDNNNRDSVSQNHRTTTTNSQSGRHLQVVANNNSNNNSLLQQQSDVNENLKAIKLACRVSHHKLVTYLGHFPFRQIGAASMSCCVNESDYLANNNNELTGELSDLKNVPNINLLVIDSTTIVTFIGSSINHQTSKNVGPIRLIVRNLCGKYSWDASCLGLELMNQSNQSSSSDADNNSDSIVVDPDLFQQEDARSPMKLCDLDFNDEGNSSSSLSSRSSSNRDYVGDLLNQLGSLVTSGGSASSSSAAQNSYKKKNCAQSISNPKFKVAQAEETMIALLTNQRFQELNYCERPDEFDKVVLNFNSNKTINNRKKMEELHEQSSDSTSSSNLKVAKQLTFEQCRQFIQQLGYLSWEKRNKLDSLAKSSRLLRELKNLDAQPSRETHKIALFYIANGQEDKNSILSNSTGSRLFEDFVSGLGWEINLASHLGFKGGLQANKSTGETSPYYCNSTTEVIFHVSTRLPIVGPPDDENLNKKLRHLGNDEIHIVFSEHNRDYRRGIIPTEFGDVIIAIYPMLTFQGYYRIQISSKPDVPMFGPLFDNCIVHQTSLASLVRATAINASRAKRLKLPYYQSHFEERSRLIETIVRNHKEKLSFEDFAVQLYHTATTTPSVIKGH